MKNSSKLGTATTSMMILLGFAILMSFKELRWNFMLFLYLSPLNFNNNFLFNSLWNLYLSAEINYFSNFLSNEFKQDEIPEIDGSEYKDWNTLYSLSNGLTYPVKINGFYNETIPVNTWFTDEWVDNHKEFELMEFGKKQVNENGILDSKYQVHKTSFDKFIDNLRSGNRSYAYGLDEIFLKYPELIEEMEFSKFGHSKNMRDNTFCRTLSAFISSSGQSFGIHNEVTNNMIIQIKGQKIFNIINPKYSALLSPYIKDNPFSTGYGIDIASNVTGLADIINDKLIISIELNPGDVLFIPSWWWHHVESNTLNDEDIVFMNNCRFVNTLATFRSNPILELFGGITKKNWIHPIFSEYVRFIPYFRSFQEGFREYFNILPFWDDELDCYSSKRKGCVNYFNFRNWVINEQTY